VKSPESVMTSSFLLLFPLTMASNIFVDPKTMPRLLQVLVSVNPVSHLANASRGLMHGDVRAGDVIYVLVATAVISAVFAPIALRMYHRER
jgi:ABC-2 type transport system permease protein